MAAKFIKMDETYLAEEIKEAEKIVTNKENK